MYIYIYIHTHIYVYMYTQYTIVSFDLDNCLMRRLCKPFTIMVGAPCVSRPMLLVGVLGSFSPEQ